MDQAYSFKHWLTTLLLAPFLPSLYELIFHPIKGEIIGLLEIYPVTFIFSLIFSAPTFIVYYYLYAFLIKKQTSPVLTKLILICLTVAGIVITFLLMRGTLATTLIFAYSISAIVMGVLLRIRSKATNTE